MNLWDNRSHQHFSDWIIHLPEGHSCGLWFGTPLVLEQVKWIGWIIKIWNLYVWDAGWGRSINSTGSNSNNITSYKIYSLPFLWIHRDPGTQDLPMYPEMNSANAPTCEFYPCINNNNNNLVWWHCHHVAPYNMKYIYTATDLDTQGAFNELEMPWTFLNNNNNNI